MEPIGKLHGPAVEHNFLGSTVSLLLPILLFGVLFWFLMGRVGGGSSVMKYSKSRAKKFWDKPEVRFSDVARRGRIAELEEIREFHQHRPKVHPPGYKDPQGRSAGTALPAPVRPCSPRLWRTVLLDFWL